jgi:hypothetical protein
MHFNLSFRACLDSLWIFNNRFVDLVFGNWFLEEEEEEELDRDV